MTKDISGEREGWMANRMQMVYGKKTKKMLAKTPSYFLLQIDHFTNEFLGFST